MGATGGSKASAPFVVSGVGAVSPFGFGAGALFAGLARGEAAIKTLELFDTSRHRTAIAGEVRGSEPPALLGLRPRDRSRLSRTDLFAVAAALEALEQAGIAPGDLDADAGVFLGSSAGGMFEGEQFFWDVTTKERVRASRVTSQPNNCPAAAVARVLGVFGPVETMASACAAATMSIESALCALGHGEIEVALAGGADGLCQLTYGGFNALRAVDEHPARPFRADRGGLSIGEGAGILVIERADRALRRGATPLAVIAGAASSCDAHHMTAPEPNGRGAAEAMAAALAAAGIDAGEVDFVNAHGTGTPHNDEAEYKALAQVFGERVAALPVTSNKGAVGHLLGACGGLEAVATVLSLVRGEVTPTPGPGVVDEACPVDLVRGEVRRPERCRTAISLNLAFGGANAALVVQRYTEECAE